MLKVAAMCLVCTPVFAWAAETSIPGYDGEVKKTLDRMEQRYAGMKTYQHTLECSFDIEAEGNSDWLDAMMNMAKQATRFAWARPDRATLISKETTVVCDGKQVWEYVPELRQYVNYPMPAVLALDELKSMEMQGGQAMQDPIAGLLLQHSLPPAKRFREVIRFTGVKSQDLEGKACWVVRGLGGSERMQGFEVPFEIWINAENDLLQMVRVDLTEAMKSMSAMSMSSEDEEEGKTKETPPKIKKYQMVVKPKDVKIDEDIPADRFTFKPGQKDQKVEEFTSEGGEEKQQELVGQSAPVFAGKDLDGKEVRLADLKGRVVLLDFWATWCGPCVQVLPEVQKVADHFAKQPVTVLGINQDAGGSGKRLVKFLEKKQVKYRQVLDGNSEISSQYYVQGIPCMVLIDKKGVIQAIDVGFSSGGESELIAKIDRLLKGETLVDLKETTRPAGQPGTASAVAPGVSQSAPASSPTLVDVAPERLREEPSARLSGVYQIKEADVTGDGRRKLVASTPSNTIVIIDPETLKTERVQLKGRSRRSSVSGVAAVQTKNGLLWLAQGSDERFFGRGTASIQVSLHDRAGGLLWTYEQKFEAGSQVQSIVDGGDLDGDGQPEFVVGITVYQISKSGSNSWTTSNQRGQLVVLDRNGSVICSRRAGQGLFDVKAFPSKEPGKPGRVFIIDGRGAHFYQLTGAATVPASQAAVGK